MAWRTAARRGARRSSTSTQSSSSRGRGGRRRAPTELADSDVARGIDQSALRVRVALELCSVHHDAKSLRDVCVDFERTFDAHRSAAVTARHDVRVELLECGLNKWQHVVELQRVLAALKRLEENGEQLELQVETMLQQDVKKNEWKLSVGFTRASEDAIWRIANSLILRLKSCEVLAMTLLPTHRLVVPLLLSREERSDVEHEKYQWKGRLTWSQVTLDAAVGDQRQEIQRVVLQPIDAAKRAFSVAEMRYPGLADLVDDMLRSNAGSGKPVVVIMRGIPGSGKSTLGRELEALCSHKRVAFTMCSADLHFATPRGYVFNGKELSAAHGKCKDDYRRAVTGAISEGNKQSSCYQHVVLVENTSTQKWEYAPYEDIAQTFGCRVHIVELKCPDVLTALRMGRRNAHGVPPLKVVSMYLRWEEDTRAHSFTPQFEHGLLSANPVSDGDVGNLIYVGLFLDEKSRTELAARIPAAHVNKYADHVTLFYQPNLQYVRDVELGALGSVRGVEVVQDDRGQALRVEVDRNLHLQRRNKIPHVTLSTAHRVKPVYSNDLLSISSAKRAAVDPPLDLKARVGAVFSVEKEQVVTTTSPFAVDDSAHDSSRTHRDVDNDVSPQRSNAAKSKLFILHVRECDFAKDTDETRTKLRGMAQVLYQMGSGCKARLLCIQKSQTSPLSVSALMKRVQSRFLLSATQSFDDVVSFCEPVSSNAFDETICKYLDTANFGLHKQVTILTTDAEILQRPVSEVRCFQDSALSVSWIGQECAVSRDKRMLESPCTSLSAMLDSLGINVEERTRSVILRGISAIEEAWTRVSAVKDDGALHRIDTTIMSMSSPVIDLCLVLPSGTSSSEEATLQGKLLSELRGARSVRHIVCDSSVPDRFYFSLCTASSYTPVFCVQMTSPSKDCGGAVDKSAAVQLECWQHQLQASRELCDTEPYSVMTVLVRAILSSRCSSLLPSECRLSSLVNLISEHLVLHYFKSTESCGEVDAVPSAADVASGRIIYSLYRMLTYLSKVNADEWPAIFGAPLQTLQGDQRAQAAWSRAMEDVMQSCSAAMVKYPRVAQGLSRATRLNLSDHLEAISALIEPRVDPTYSASSVRAVAIVSSHVEWSLVHSLALCDKLRHAAALRVTRADNDDRSTEEDDPARRVFFSCAPSVVARRIDVTTSSLEILRDVMTKTGDASEAAERDVAHDATSCHVESEDDGAWDLNQSRIDVQWEVDAPDGRIDVVD